MRQEVLSSCFLLLCAQVMHETSKANAIQIGMAFITLPPCILNISVFSSIAYVYSKTRNSRKSRKPQNVLFPRVPCFRPGLYIPVCAVSCMHSTNFPV